MAFCNLRFDGFEGLLSADNASARCTKSAWLVAINSGMSTVRIKQLASRPRMNFHS
jgi:hypothetical protein